MLALQIQNVMEGVLDPGSVFASPPSKSLIDECFLWFTKSAVLMKSQNFKNRNSKDLDSSSRFSFSEFGTLPPRYFGTLRHEPESD